MYQVRVEHKDGRSFFVAGCTDKFIANFIRDALNNNALTMNRPVTYIVTTTKEDSSDKV